MNVLMVGSGKGSWQMRGEQLGAAMGARVRTDLTAADLDWADVVVLVKRYGPLWAARCHQADKPIVWDALDFWRQPAENGYDEGQGRMLLTQERERIRPALTIGATQEMAHACRGEYLPHHSWDGLHPTPAREHVSVVGYEGSPVYLGRWQTWLQAACEARGWRFVVNPPDLRQVDLLVAFRDGPFDGWMCRAWKSGVKIVNAIAAGRPLLTQESAAWRELQSHAAGASVETRAALEIALDHWTDYDRRRACVALSEDCAPLFDRVRIGACYHALLETKVTACLS